MKSSLFLFAAALVLAFTGCKSETKEKETFSYEQPNTSSKKASSQNDDALKPSQTVDLSTKGIGPVTEVVLPATIDAEMAARGEKVFVRACTVCHTTDKRMVGPAMKGITKKRTPEWIMNLIINPQKMAMEDPLAKALLEEYKQAIMPNQGITEAQARDILEYFRQIDGE
ncbi:c-type cytochrome [Robertkochia sediminum]|uniref:c-type cytochrome n=1 Tax=Robertkochia sediminum TaxID=2785326 RepID=UPI001933EBA6|nr:cytochrome c [Robertkochia sediminum]MBL7471441.1 cytochrome c [Robertkochia sediminum]